MKKHMCNECKLRAKYDEKPNSFVGKFWRWHINFCPGWKAYLKSLDNDAKNKLKLKYNLKNS
ncbi:hypothetical protein SAMN05444411_10126 [Lutibacter oricola]|uniref:Uncharacterized protein n=1 Tax=Lutibacter oricola TaxID=762486 RepID=A0A1H2QKG1_9FLAO|nr:hypothetical protein [Lutibacter oricola]SDW07662.1 hypothetical protein SAMN05444411_10126 [Lutibacter oricola]